MAQTEELAALDDRRFQFRLKRPFRLMLYALGYKGLLVMPERMAKTPWSQGVTEFVGSGPFVFKQDEWISGDRAVFTRFDRYLPRQEPANNFSGGKVVHFDRVEWIVQPDAAAAVLLRIFTGVGKRCVIQDGPLWQLRRAVMSDWHLRKRPVDDSPCHQ